MKEPLATSLAAVGLLSVGVLAVLHDPIVRTVGTRHFAGYGFGELGHFTVIVAHRSQSAVMALTRKQTEPRSADSADPPRV